MIRYLSADDVRACLDMDSAILAMEEAFRQLSTGQVTLPTRLRIENSRHDGAALVMPCYSAAEDYFSLKVATVYPENPAVGLPFVQSKLILTDGKTGSPSAILDGTSLTAIRTGAASGLATRLLSRPDSKVLGVIGAGVQARTQVEAVSRVRDIQSIRIFSRSYDQAKSFAESFGSRAVAVGSAREAVSNSDIICTATPALSPVFDAVDIAPGTHINAVGSYRTDMIEVPSEIVKMAKVIVDHFPSALEEAGDLVQPLRAGVIDQSHFSTELGQVLENPKLGRTSKDSITLFKSVGIAIQDLCAARMALQNAEKLGLGQLLP